MLALSLNADHSPMKVIPFTRAMSLVEGGKSYLVENYEGRKLRSAQGEMDWPAVIALYKHVEKARPRVKFCRANVLARDRYTCQYCGERQSLENLTLDHVVPRAQSHRGRVLLPWNQQWAHVTSWRNVVASCAPCNGHKGARTPFEASMELLRRPRKPTGWDCVLMPFLRQDIPDEWKRHAPPEWRGYWDDELDRD